MVNSVSNSAINSLLRAQSTGISAGIAALKGNQDAQKAIIDSLAQTAEQGKTMMAQSLKNASPSNTSLPRGSLVDILA